MASPRPATRGCTVKCRFTVYDTEYMKHSDAVLLMVQRLYVVESDSGWLYRWNRDDCWFECRNPEHSPQWRRGGPSAQDVWFRVVEGWEYKDRFGAEETD